MTDGFGFGAGDLGGATVLDETTVPTTADELGGDFQFDEAQPGGKYPPRVTPGPVKCSFEFTELRERENGTGDKRSVHVLANGKVPTLIYNVRIPVATLAPGRLLKDNGESEVIIRFNELSGFKSAKMAEKHVSTDIERAYVALGFLKEFGPPKSLQQMVDMLKGCGVRPFLCDQTVGWSAAIKFDDGTYGVYSTKPNTKRGDKPFPRDDKGALLTTVKFPNGEERTAREEIVGINVPKAPKAGATT